MCTDVGASSPGNTSRAVVHQTHRGPSARQDARTPTFNNDARHDRNDRLDPRGGERDQHNRAFQRNGGLNSHPARYTSRGVNDRSTRLQPQQIQRQTPLTHDRKRPRAYAADEGDGALGTQRVQEQAKVSEEVIRQQYLCVHQLVVDSERRDGETFEQCAHRFGFHKEEYYVRQLELEDITRPEPPGDFKLDIEIQVQEHYRERDDEIRRKRIEKRRQDIEKRDKARRQGQTAVAVYARKVDDHGNSTPVVCMKWLAGLCIYGDLCPELHTWSEHYLPPCAFFATNGFCAREECPYKHAEDETERFYYHCESHLRGVQCSLGDRCPDMHVPAKFGTRTHAHAGGLSLEDRRASPQEVCAAPEYSLAYTPRAPPSHLFVSLNRLVDVRK